MIYLGLYCIRIIINLVVTYGEHIWFNNGASGAFQDT